MRFQLAHRLVTYGLALAAMGAVAGTRALSPISAALFTAACMLSFFADPGSRLATVLDRSANAVRVTAVALFAFLLWRIWRRLPDPDYGPGFDLGLALLGYKLFTRRSHRDYIHILAFSALLVLVASTMAASFVFIVCFAIFGVLAVWALILFHLRREMEENYLVKHSAQAPSQKVGVGRILGSRRVVGFAFFVVTGAVAIVVLMGATAIFMLVPRFGAGFVLGAPTPAGNAVALGDEVALGRYGTRPAAAHAVVVRATLPAIAALPDEAVRRDAVDALYVRGAVYDVYDSGRWARSGRPELGTVVVEEAGLREGHRFWVRELDAPPRPEGPGWDPNGERELGSALRQEIEVVGMPTSVLFAVDRPLAFELPAGRLGAAGSLRVTPRWSGETALKVGGADRFLSLAHAHYVAYSDPPTTGSLGHIATSPSTSPDALLRPVLTPIARAAYLGLPPRLAARLVPVAEDLGGAPDSPERISAVVGWLRGHHAYSLDALATPAGHDPVEAFVFSDASGHCELFASAAVLLLRAGGLPARYVTGFRGGEWNGMGGYLAIRDDRAHAWAEAFLPDRGWVRVDATPPGAPLARPGRLTEAVEALDYLWSRWIVAYDLPRQRDLAQRAGRKLSPLGTASSWRRPAQLATGGALVLAVAALIVALRRVWQRRTRPTGAPDGMARWRPAKPARGPEGAIERLYQKTVARLARKGFARRGNETPREYARRIQAAGLSPTGAFDHLTEWYSAARFGAHPVDDGGLDELAAKLANDVAAGSQRGTAGPETRV